MKKRYLGIGIIVLAGMSVFTQGNEGEAPPAVSLKRQGEIRRVIALLEPAMKTDTENAELFSTLGMLYQRLGDVAGAEATLKKAVALDGSNTGARFMLALTYEKQQKNDLAIQEWQGLLKEALNPNMKASAERHLKLLQGKP